MQDGGGYNIGPQTPLSPAGVALAVVCGLAIMAFSFFVVGSGLSGETIGDFTDFTVTNRTDGEVTVLLDRIIYGRVGGEERTFSTYEWNGRRLVQMVDERGRIIYSERLSKGDLKRVDYRIVIEPITEEVAPVGDLSYEYPPCYGPDLDACLEGQTELEPYFSDSCEGEGRRLCFMPLGRVSPELVLDLAAHYEDQYGIQVSVLTSSDIPKELVDPLRGQIDAATLIDYAVSLRPEEYGDSDVVLIAITPVDLYDRTISWRFLFGLKGTFADPDAIVSTFRMNPESFGEPRDDQLTTARARKLITKYVGLLYFDLPISDDPKSPMFDNILSVSDLDRMEEPLPVPVGP